MKAEKCRSPALLPLVSDPTQFTASQSLFVRHRAHYQDAF